jgi:predicted lipoprotein with Yx(FWY)xxD motif
MIMKKAGRSVLAAVATVFAIAACGNTGSTRSSGRPPAARSGSDVTVNASKLGGFLTDGNDRTLYLFEADKTNASNCYSACASIWPPLTSSGAVKAKSGVVASQLGRTRRNDGATEVTYYGHPLYYYIGDAQPGETMGEGLNQFGARWYLVARDGQKIAGSH